MWPPSRKVRHPAQAAHRGEEPDGRRVRQHPRRAGIGEKTAPRPCAEVRHAGKRLRQPDDKSIKPKQREHLLECRADAELSHLLGTIRHRCAHRHRRRGGLRSAKGNKGAAVRADAGAGAPHPHPPVRAGRRRPRRPHPKRFPRWRAPSEELPCPPAGHYSGGHPPRRHGRAGVKMVLQPEAWYAVQGTTVYPLNSGRAGAAAGRPGVTLDVFDSAPLTHGHGPRRLGQQHRLGRQAGCLPAGRLGLQVSGHRAADQLPRQGRLHL